MKTTFLTVILLLSGLSFASSNSATGDLLDARYDLAACNVDYADKWLDMRHDCADSEEVPVFDSDPYMDDLYDDLADLEEAASEPDQFEFGLASVQLGADSLDLLGAIVVDALTNKTLPFFSCVREGEKPLIEDLDDCKMDAMQKEKDAAADYVSNEIDYADEQIDDMQELGADTDGMEMIVAYGKELVDDIGPAYDSGDQKEVRKLHLRHSRLLMLFRGEKMISTIDHARPIIEDGNNANKEEILDRGDDLRNDVENWLLECEYSAEVPNPNGYARENLECWDDGIDLMEEFNSIRMLILDGVLG